MRPSLLCYALSMPAQKKSLKGYYGTTFLIGLGFFTIGLMDPLYDTFVPMFLQRYISSHALVGLIMTLDNVLAIFLIPIFSAMSDRTRTPIGRRMPYIVTCMPLTAFAFGLIPYAALTGLLALICLLFLLNLAKQAVRGPIVALMPDMVPADLRSEANGVINTMGGIAAIVGTVALARLMDVKVPVPGMEEAQKDVLAFPVAGVFVLVATILLFLFVHEPKEATGKADSDEQKEPLLHSIQVVFHEKDKSALFILLSLLCWFLAYQGILPFIGVYSKDVLGTSSGLASLAAGMVGISYAIFAIPSGSFAHRHGRRKTIRASLMLLVVILVVLFVHGGIAFHSPLVQIGLFWGLMFLFGIFWVSVVTNSFPMLWQMADYATIGIYTGLYYFFNQLASVLAPPMTGWCIDLFGYRSIFLYGAVMMGIAFFLMGKVDRGEPEEDSRGA